MKGGVLNKFPTPAGARQWLLQMMNTDVQATPNPGPGAEGARSTTHGRALLDNQREPQPWMQGRGRPICRSSCLKVLLLAAAGAGASMPTPYFTGKGDWQRRASGALPLALWLGPGHRPAAHAMHCPDRPMLPHDSERSIKW